MLSLDEACAQLCAQAPTLAQREWLTLEQGHLRFCAEDVFARYPVPAEDNSAMDGYALRVCDYQMAVPLPLSQTIAAGQNPHPLKPGTIARILTGASIPEGADCVVIQENCTRHGDRVDIHMPPKAGDNIRPAGQDVAAEALVCHQGERVGAASLALLAACGHAGFWGLRKPRVALLNTGSELIEPGSQREPGRIFNSNQPMLRALLNQWGCEIIATVTVADDFDETEKRFREAAAQADLLITSGGVSVGDEDHVKQVIEKLGSLNLWKINLKPGKPLAFGHITTGNLPVPIIGLPGNPVSAMIGALFFVRPFLWKMHGAQTPTPSPHKGIADFTLQRRSSRPEFIRVQRNADKLSMYPNQSSGVISSLRWADALAWVDGNAQIQPGDPITYYSLDELIN